MNIIHANEWEMCVIYIYTDIHVQCLRGGYNCVEFEFMEFSINYIYLVLK